MKLIQLRIYNTRPVGHGYVFSMAVGTIGEWLKPSGFGYFHQNCRFLYTIYII